MALGKFLSHCKPQFSHLNIGTILEPNSGLFWGWNRRMYVKCLAQCLAIAPWIIFFKLKNRMQLFPCLRVGFRSRTISYILQDFVGWFFLGRSFIDWLRLSKESVAPQNVRTPWIRWIWELKKHCLPCWQVSSSCPQSFGYSVPMEPNRPVWSISFYEILSYLWVHQKTPNVEVECEDIGRWGTIRQL